MSCVLNKLLTYFSGRSRTFAFFLIFLACTALVLFCNILIQKNAIQQLRIALLETALDEYLLQNSLLTQSHFTLQNAPSRHFDFIRIIRAKDQLLITSSSGSMDFTGLIDLAPAAHGAWVDLNEPAKPGSWLLISRILADGSRVQAGKNDTFTGRAIYRELVRASYRTLLFSVLPCFGLALLCSAIMKKPLQTLQKDIKTALTHKSQTLPAKSEKLHDLQPLYQLLEELFQQNRQLIKEMQSSLDNVAHDLRTPMTRLRAVAEYALQSDNDKPLIYRNALSDCLEESERVLSMLKIMMSVAEAEAGTLQLKYEELNIRESLQDVIGLYQYVAEEEQITVSLECAENILIQADKTRLSQVWANLLDNGIKYGHESGKVTISALQTAQDVIVSFTDNGMGISDAEADRIWDRLYRGDRSRTRQGLGLGLNYVKAVVEAHQGQVTLRSVIREGSTFTVSLPLRHAP